MQNFHFYAPTYFAFGRGAEAETGALVRRFGGSKVLVHYGQGSVVRNGILSAVLASLEEAGIPYVELGGVLPNPRSSLVYEGIELCRRESVDFVLAVGGGSAIDSAKAIAAGVPYEGDFWDYYGQGKPVDSALPIGTVLTIAAAGSEGSGDSVITNDRTMQKWGASGEALRPRFSVLNPAFTCTLPPYQTACGITDIMVHVLERYFTPTRDVETTDRLCEAVLLSMIAEAPRVMADPACYEARANIMWAGMVAHNNIVGVGRAQDWASHNLEHELSALYDCAHGAGLAVITPAWMEYVWKTDVDRFARFAHNVWGVDVSDDREAMAREGIRRFRLFLRSIGMPLSFSEIGAKEEDIPRLVESLSSLGTVGVFVKIGKAEAEAIYRLALDAHL